MSEQHLGLGVLDGEVLLLLQPGHDGVHRWYNGPLTRGDLRPLP